MIAKTNDINHPFTGRVSDLKYFRYGIIIPKIGIQPSINHPNNLDATFKSFISFISLTSSTPLLDYCLSKGVPFDIGVSKRYVFRKNRNIRFCNAKK
jgi:hypothetical protein